jgi:protein subunit release factor A
VKLEHLRCEVLYPVQNGGQQVGDTCLGIRVTHMPTNLQAFCDHERSQIKNKKIAIAMIEWGLVELGWEDLK